MILTLVGGTLDLTLEQARMMALENSYHYQEARAKLGKSKLTFAENLSYLLPTPQGSASYTKTQSEALDTKTYAGNLTISQPVFDLPLFTQIRAAHYQYAGNRLDYRRDVQDLLLKVEVAYLNLVRTRELLKSVDLTVKRTEENERLTVEKLNLGAASKLDRLQAEVFSLQAQRDLSAAQKSYFEAQEAIKTFLQVRDEIVPVDSLSPSTNRTDSLPALDSLISVLDEINIGLKAVKQTRNVARLNMITSYFKFLPRLSLFFRYGFAMDDMPESFDDINAHDTKSYGVNVELPLFNIRDLYFSNRQARAGYQHQKYVFLRTLAETRQALITTYLAIGEVENRVRLGAKSLELALEAANIAKERYRLGAASIIDLLTAEENLYKARVNYIGAIADYRIEKTKLGYFIGTLEAE